MQRGQGPDRAQAADVSRLLDEYGTRLLRFAALYLKDAHLAEDAVQEAFLQAARHWQDFRGDSSELTWLTAITRNCCRSMQRSRWFRLNQRSVPLDAVPLPDDSTADSDDSLLQEVLGLPRKYREILLLYYYQELPLKDISALLKTNMSTLSTRLRRARALLRTRLEGWWFDGE